MPAAERRRRSWQRVASGLPAAVLLLAVFVAGTASASAAGGYTVSATIDVGGSPAAAAVDADTHTVLVTNASSGVSVIDEAANAVTATVAVGAATGVAVDATTHTGWVSGGADSSVSVIDEATSTVAATIPVSVYQYLNAIAVDPATRMVYVTADVMPGNLLFVISETTRTTIEGISVGNSEPANTLVGVAVDPAAHTVYVASANNAVYVIDETTSTVTGTIPVTGWPRGIAVDPASHKVYVASSDGTVSVISEATNTVTATIAVGSGPRGIAVDPAAHTVYVANSTADTVSVIDEAADAVIATIAVGAGPSGVAVDPTTHAAYIADGRAGTVSVITPTPGPPLAITTTSPLPDGTAGVPYTAALSATGGDPPYTWAITIGNLPAGLSLDTATGAITGIPATPETVTFAVQVTDTGDQTAATALAVTINPKRPDLAITLTPAGAFRHLHTGRLHIAVSNTGTATTTSSPVVRITLPPGVVPLGVQGSGWASYQGRLTFRHPAPLQPGHRATLTLEVWIYASAGSMVTITGTVTPADDTPADNTATIQMPIQNTRTATQHAAGKTERAV